jgi:drug/metabolite transporter (DMT)-like permease
MRLKADFLLLFVSILWGSAFAVLRLAAGHHTIFLLNGARFFLGGLLLLPWLKWKSAFRRSNLLYILLAGLALYAGGSLQQAGLASTTAGNGGFITALSVVIVPFYLWAGWRERPSLVTGLGVVLALAGAFLLSTGGSFRVGRGDVLVFLGAFLWALHIVVVGKGLRFIEPLPFAFGQFILCGLLNLATGAMFERPIPADLLQVLPAVLYTAVLSIAVGFTLQVVAQKHTPPSDAVLIMSMEAVFAALFGWAYLGERLQPVQLVGCALILAAVVLVQARSLRLRALPALE